MEVFHTLLFCTLFYIQSVIACSIKSPDKQVVSKFSEIINLPRRVSIKFRNLVPPENLKFAAGDIISCDISLAAQHLFLASSSDTVIHATGPSGDNDDGRTEIVEEKFSLAAYGMYNYCNLLTEKYDAYMRKVCFNSPSFRMLTVSEAVDNARASVVAYYQKTASYDVTSCNCEHWVSSWKYNRSVSYQISKVSLHEFNIGFAGSSCEAPGFNHCPLGRLSSTFHKIVKLNFDLTNKALNTFNKVNQWVSGFMHY